MRNPLGMLFGQSKQQELVKKPLEDQVLQIIAARCPQNHACPSVRVCPVSALSQSGYQAPVVDMDRCIKCGKCVKSCPKRALILA